MSRFLMLCGLLVTLFSTMLISSAQGVCANHTEILMIETANGLIELPVVMMGDLEIATLPQPDKITLEAIPNTNANIRATPNQNASVLAVASRGVAITASGRSGSWIEVILPDDPLKNGWIFGDLLDVAGDIQTLSEHDATGAALEITPTALEISGTDECASVMIQTASSVTLIINEQVVDIHGTILVDFAEDEMRITNLAGYAVLTQDNDAVSIPAGAAFDAELVPAQDFFTERILPVHQLTEIIIPAEPLTQEQIDRLTAPFSERIVPNFTATYGCVSRETQSMNWPIGGRINNLREFTNCSSTNVFSYFKVNGQVGSPQTYRLVSADGNIVLDGGATIVLDPVSMMQPNGQYSIFMPLTFPAIGVPSMPVHDGPDLPAFTLSPSMQGSSVVYSGGYTWAFSMYTREVQETYTFDASTGLLTRMEHTSTVIGCYCESNIRTPFIEQHWVFELQSTNQPLGQ